MYKISIFSIAFGILFFIANSALATVGGPTYISEIAFQASENFVYYKVNSESGRGCPPIVYKVNLNTNNHSAVKSCDQFEQEFSYDESGIQKYNQFMSGIYQNLSYLGSVSLVKNKIDIKVEYLSENKLEGFDEPVSNNFLASINQDGKKIGEINFKGCAKDQPHVFEGYMIPDYDKIGILVSNKSDCFEGGYVGESLYIINGIKYYDTNIVRSFKTASATEPNAGNVVVYANTQTPQPGTLLPEETTVPNKNNNKILYIMIIIFGLGLGYFFGRKVQK